MGATMAYAWNPLGGWSLLQVIPYLSDMSNIDISSACQLHVPLCVVMKPVAFCVQGSTLLSNDQILGLPSRGSYASSQSLPLTHYLTNELAPFLPPGIQN